MIIKHQTFIYIAQQEFTQRTFLSSIIQKTSSLPCDFDATTASLIF